MGEEQQGDQETFNTAPTPLPLADHSSDEESDEEGAEETEHRQLDEEQRISDNAAPIHVCEHCGKHFGSGKALGGHKRIHFQSSKWTDSRKKNRKRKKNQSPEGDHDDAVANHGCTICGKSFVSVKALYGHLRSHPDRTWRGSVNQQSSPPLRYESSPNPSYPIEPNLEDSDKPGMVNLPTYPHITLSVDVSSWTSSAPSRVEEHDTAKLLLLLACENPLKRDTANKRRLIDHEEEKMNKKKLTELRHGNVADQKTRVSCSSSSKEKKVYICSPCNKSFNSYQAYGGHVSSHNKLGSKTRSRSSPTMAATPQSTSRSDTGPSNESLLDRRKPLNIDLNELPPPEADDEGQFKSYR